jgi:predicted nucleotide-binding protein
VDSTKGKALERLKALLNEGEVASADWRESGQLTEWRRNVEAALRRLFGEDDHLNAFRTVRYSPSIYGTHTPPSRFDEAFLRGMKIATAHLRAAIREVEDYDRPDSDPRALPSKVADTRKVFVVHGHDEEMRQTVARFLERLDVEPIILHEQPNRGATVIEKFERHADVGFAIVLLSPDHVGASAANPSDLQARARQNAILELGYFVGALKRHRVCALVRDELELPSDIHGIVYVTFDGGSWKLDLVRELKAAGFEIDANAAF